MNVAAHVDGSRLPVSELVELAEVRLGPLGKLRTARAEANGFATKASSLFVTLTFETVETELFVKRIDTDGSGRRPDPPDREVRVYEALDEDDAFAAPAFLGTVDADGPHLVLARIPGWDLRYRDLEVWQEAAAALGRMHAFYAHLVEAEGAGWLPFLPRLDGEHHLAEAHLALEVVQRAFPQAASSFESIVADYRDVAAELDRRPWTLLHGDLAPKNALMDPTDPPQALFVDWEWAAVGPGSLDLADLVNGLDPPAADAVLQRYVAEARGTALPESDEAIERSLRLGALQRIVFRLGRSADWKVELPQVEAWVRAAASHLRGLGSR
ncbi:MAG TPA: phosphotransferase [Actinomycetota bacterium]|nr:phosphotransferase [Actinomycetota bacterium]